MVKRALHVYAYYYSYGGGLVPIQQGASEEFVAEIGDLTERCSSGISPQVFYDNGLLFSISD